MEYLDEMIIATTQEQWLDLLMNTYGEPLTKLAFTYVRDWGKAQEIVQDVFITCYTQYHKRHTIKSYKAWIYRITINRAKDHYRTAWFKRVVVMNNWFHHKVAPGLTIENQMIQQEADTTLSHAVLDLDAKYREVILLYYYEELAVKDIAHILNCSENTVKTRLKRGREQLKNKLEGSGI
ncbi:sigma-70 family RNA polymerase sigma factor [Solibacillus sp. CAU 1738]|uniref:sigma-70 family RNA polymerase sigma factor n=1 Tax=Solibacillus sp. CAU 1738 TaxID=3140363 RepID=UPI003260F072